MKGVFQFYIGLHLSRPFEIYWLVLELGLTMLTLNVDGALSLFNC
jgi:hypothetical protein